MDHQADLKNTIIRECCDIKLYYGDNSTFSQGHGWIVITAHGSCGWRTDKRCDAVRYLTGQGEGVDMVCVVLNFSRRGVTQSVD